MKSFIRPAEEDVENMKAWNNIVTLTITCGMITTN